MEIGKEVPKGSGNRFHFPELGPAFVASVLYEYVAWYSVVVSLPQRCASLHPPPGYHSFCAGSAKKRAKQFTSSGKKATKWQKKRVEGARLAEWRETHCKRRRRLSLYMFM